MNNNKNKPLRIDPELCVIDHNNAVFQWKTVHFDDFWLKDQPYPDILTNKTIGDWCYNHTYFETVDQIS